MTRWDASSAVIPHWVTAITPFDYAQGRLYEDGTDWLLRETWHSYVSGNTFDLSRYW